MDHQGELLLLGLLDEEFNISGYARADGTWKIASTDPVGVSRSTCSISSRVVTSRRSTWIASFFAVSSSTWKEPRRCSLALLPRPGRA